VPGVAGGPTENARVGIESTVKGVKDARSPLLPVTVIVYGFPVRSAPERTMNEPLTTPVVVDTLQLCEVIILGVDPAEVEDMMQLVSILKKPVP
jgi:hypothetical protein